MYAIFFVCRKHHTAERTANFGPTSHCAAARRPQSSSLSSANLSKKIIIKKLFISKLFILKQYKLNH